MKRHNNENIGSTPKRSLLNHSSPSNMQRYCPISPYNTPDIRPEMRNGPRYCYSQQFVMQGIDPNLLINIPPPWRPQVVSNPYSVMFNPSQPPPPLPVMVQIPPPNSDSFSSPSPLPKDKWNKKSISVPSNNDLRHTNLSNGSPSPTLTVPLKPIMSQNSPNSDDVHEPEKRTNNKKGKRKPMSLRYKRLKPWNKNDAVKALALENEYNRLRKRLILKFPDPELNKEIVKGYSAAIENVHFQQPSTSRYCFVQLQPNSNFELVKEEISKITFGTGKIIVEEQISRDEGKPEASLEEIDPYTLYIGNLSKTVSVSTVREKFPTAKRVEIGFAQQMKHTRYAFLRYDNVEDAMEAFKQTFNIVLDSRSLIVRFWRENENERMAGELGNPTSKHAANENNVDKSNLQSESRAVSVNLNDSTSTDTLTVTICANISEQNGTNQSKDNTNPIESTFPCASTSNARTDSDSIETVISSEPEDSKVNVLREAEELLRRKMGTSVITSDGLTIKGEKFDEDRDMKVSKILGIKVEAINSDEDTEQDNYNEEVDDEDDESDAYEEQDDEGASYYGTCHWDRLRLQELNERDIKPNLDTLPVFNKIPSAPTEVNEKSQNSDDLDSLFNEMNPDDNLADLEF